MFARKLIFLFLLNIFLSPTIKMETTSMISDLEPLLETQKNIIKVLEETIREKKNTLRLIERELQRYKNEYKKIEPSPRHYLGNPINTVTLIKRQTVDLDYIEAVISGPTGLMKNESWIFPSNEIFQEAVQGLYRLQSVYNLNTTQLADGILKTDSGKDGRMYLDEFLPMTTFDCYDIGQTMCQRNFCKLGVLWLREAYRIFGRDQVTFGLGKVEILWAISRSYSNLDDNENYIEWTEKLKALKPKNVDLIDLDIYMDIHRVRIGKKQFGKLKARELKEKLRRKPKMKKQTPKMKPINPIEEVKNCKNKGLTNGYKLLCRGEINVGSFIQKRLKCWFLKNNAFTILAPLKVEQLYVKPDIFLVYNVLHDEEIENIKNFVLPKLISSKTFTRNVSFHDHHLKEAMQMTQRISDFTRLNSSSSEPYYVNNYGVWGLYPQHVDYWENPKTTEEVGNRLATVLFFMEEVEQGGATVFPALGLTVFPVKGAALYWTNLLPSGLGNNVTCHGSCPVIRGNKWVITKWINSRYQELWNHCTTKFQSRLAKDIPPPERKRSISGK